MARGCAPTYGGMLRDVAYDRITQFRACDDKERELGLQMVAVITEELEKAARQGLLVPDGEASRQRLGPAVRNMSMELADRSERMAQADSLPIDDSWGNSLEGEEVEVGIAITRWLRDRLPSHGVQREDLYMQVIQGLRAQLTQGMQAPPSSPYGPREHLHDGNWNGRIRQPG